MNADTDRAGPEFDLEPMGQIVVELSRALRGRYKTDRSAGARATGFGRSFGKRLPSKRGRRWRTAHTDLGAKSQTLKFAP
jgi:hypothetical protein